MHVDRRMTTEEGDTKIHLCKGKESDVALKETGDKRNKGYPHPNTFLKVPR